MNRNIFKWIGICIISTLFLCLDIYAAPGVTKNINAGKVIIPVQTDTTSGTHKKSSSHMKHMNKKRSDSTSVKHGGSSMPSDTSMTPKKKKMSKGIGMMKPPKDQADFISGMTRYLNRRVKLNSDQVDKVHQVLTDYFTLASSDINNVNNTAVSSGTNTNGQIFAGTHNPTDTTTYISPYASLNHTGGTANTIGTTSGSGSDTGSAMYNNQRAGAKGKPGNDSTNQNKVGAMENNTAKQDITTTTPSMSSGSASIADRSVELDKAGIQVEKQIESILTDDQNTKFASIKDNYIDLVRQQALTVKSK